MKEYRPIQLINLPRWIEAIIQYFFFLALIIIFKKLGIKNLPASTSSFEIVVTVLLFLAYKVLGTYTAVDLIIIDQKNQQIEFSYWFFYMVKKKLIINFDELNYKNRNEILLLGGSMGLYIYKKESLKIKINRRNGWKDQQIDSITDYLLTIKDPLTPIKKRDSNHIS